MDETRLAKVAAYAERKILEAEDPESGSTSRSNYRWEHTLRVTHYGKQIAEAEGANAELCAAGCLLHDTEWAYGSEYKNHGRNAARVIRPFLQETGYSDEEVEAICYAVAVHVDGSAGYEHEHTLEARVVSDADNVDRFGAYRVLLTCKDQMDDYNALAETLQARVERLDELLTQDVLETPTGNRMFHDQVRLQLDFFRALLKEHAITGESWDEQRE